MIRKRDGRQDPGDVRLTGASVVNSTIGGANVQVGGDVHGAIVAGDLNVQVVAGQSGSVRPVDEGAALAAEVARYCRRNRSARPSHMAEHPAVAVLVDRMSTMGSRQVLVVHGRAGAGKTNVVTDVLDKLCGQGWTAGVVRMDAVDQVVRSAVALGARVNLPESPLLAVERASGDGPCVLVVDQLDAVSLYSGRMPDSYDAVLEILEQAVDHPQVKIVFGGSDRGPHSGSADALAPGRHRTRGQLRSQ